MVELIEFSYKNLPSPLLFDTLSALTKKSTSASSVLSSKIPFVVMIVRVLRRIVPDKANLLETYLRAAGILSGFHSTKFIENCVVRSNEELEFFLTEKNNIIITASLKNEIVGIICMEPAKEAGMAYLHTLHVNPGNRRSGLGTSLCEKAIQTAKDRRYLGVSAIALAESLDLFIRLGFKWKILNKVNHTFYLSRLF
jgi:N-acetylglutamate synthase-like GNAT family acetyltransferase